MFITRHYTTNDIKHDARSMQIKENLYYLKNNLKLWYKDLSKNLKLAMTFANVIENFHSELFGGCGKITWKLGLWRVYF